MRTIKCATCDCIIMENLKRLSSYIRVVTISTSKFSEEFFCSDDCLHGGND